MASVYGSSPVEHAALQTRMRFVRAPAAASAFHFGKSRSVRNSKCFGSRKKCVSFVDTRSNIVTRSAGSSTVTRR